MKVTITIEQVEALADQIIGQDQERRQKLLRLIKAEARIANNREPGKFVRPATAYVSGASDGSYPPDGEYGDHTGPRSMKIRSADTDQVRTSGGFYHDWRYATERPGIRVTAEGAIYIATWEGTGSFGQFPAHPGDCGVEATISFDRADVDELDLDDLVEIESELRAVAFPLTVEADPVAV